MARKTRGAFTGDVPDALLQLKQMIDGASRELSSDRPHAAGTLAVAGAIRAVDLICDATLGEHSVAPNHTAAIDLLSTVPDSEDLVEDFSLCQTHKNDFNYHVSTLSVNDARLVMDASRRLAKDAVRRVKEKGWFPTGLNENDFRFE